MSLEGVATAENILRGKINSLNTLVINAYDLAVKNGFEGTEAEWLASLIGDKGDVGVFTLDGEKTNIDMDGFKVTGLGEPTEKSDAVSLEYASTNYKPKDWMPTAEEVGAAPAGFGFGEKMTYVDMTADAYSGMTFTEAVDTVLATMPGYSCAQVQFYDPDNGYHGDKFVGKLWKYTANYVTLEAINYSGYKAIMRKTGGNWQPWEWENPPMLLGVEYRTTERHKGKPVYTTLLTWDTLPTAKASTGASLPNGSNATEWVDSKVYLRSNGGNVSPCPFFDWSNGTPISANSRTTNEGVYIRNYVDLSGYTAYCIAKYTKD